MYFEQIPVAIAKKNVDQFSVQEKNKDFMNESHESASAHEEWRGLAEQIQCENNPEKMIHLVRQLIAKYDESTMRVASGRRGRASRLAKS